MTLNISINLDNDAFADTHELRRILTELATSYYTAGRSGKLRDYNGNTVGTWDLIGD